MSRPIPILVLSADAARAGQWCQFLVDGDMQVWQNVRDLPADWSPDVIVTDCEIGDAPASSLPGQVWPRDDVGVVSIGEIPAGDVTLPADFTPRELQLACRLLSEVVRWRRECRRGRQLQQTLSQLALTDPLTGLPNRRAWEQEMLARATRGTPSTSSVCLALFDVDFFKSVNERFGHIAGDQVLRHIGHRLAAARRDSDRVARLGGDEFALMLEGRDQASAAAELERLRIAACDGTPHVQVTACTGFAFSPAFPPGGLDALFRQADVALRCAKLSGRNRTVAARQ